jgi:hypothetical protein
MAIVLLFASVSAEAKDAKCKEVRIELKTTVDFTNFTATGIVSGSLNGTVVFAGDPTSVAPITAEFMPPIRDAIAFTGELTMFTDDGSLTTRNVGVFEPGPSGVGVEFGTVIGGTGDYAGASGKIFFAVQGDDTGNNFSEVGLGIICTVKNKSP